jgi:hypothetical protein
MKIKFTSRQLFKTLLGIAILLAGSIQQSYSQGPNMISKPGYIMEYNHNGNSWIHNANTTVTYNSVGLPIEYLKKDPSTNLNLFKQVLTYDTQGNERSYLMYSWQNPTWNLVNGTKDSIIYNSGNKVTLQITTAFMNNAWENYSRYENTYDINNNLIEEVYSYWDTGLWILANKNVYTYDTNGIIVQKQQYSHDGSNWNLRLTEAYTAWHIPNILAASYNTTITNSMYPRRNTITLGPNGGYTDVSEYFYTFGSVWRNSSRKTVTKDSQGNITSNKTENFDLASGQWQYITENQDIYTYNNQFDITEHIVRFPPLGQQNGQPPLDRFKYVYSNFQYFANPMGISEKGDLKLEAKIYPNPAQNFISISVPENKGETTATISDVTGKTLLKEKLSSGQNQEMNIEKLPKGIYLLHLANSKASVIKKIIKQ